MRSHQLGLSLAVLVMSVGLATTAHARKMVFAETWQNGTDAWRTQLANGGDCKGWPTCPFIASEVKPGLFPAAMMSNSIFVRDHDGEGGRDATTCNGKYINIPRMYAGWDAASVAVTGGVTQSGTVHKNAQFPVAQNDRLCMVAWVRAYAEGGTEAGPYVGINYTGSHGVVDAGHNHGTHFMVGSMPTDPADSNGWVNTPRNSYGPMTQVIKDGLWHRYTASFTVDSKDLSGPRMFSPELPGSITWVNDGIIYGQPRLLLFGKAPERADSQSLSYLPAVGNGADFGDVYVFKAAAGETPCPTDAELDAMEFASDKVTCAGETVCIKKTAPLPATDRTPAYPNNVAYTCSGCTEAFGGTPGNTTCTANRPFCTNMGPKGGTCAACGGDAATSNDAATRCADAAPTCMTTGPAMGSCGKCTTSADCANANPGAASVHAGPSCNEATGACFACLTDHGAGNVKAACSAAAPLCDTATGLCGKCDGDEELKTGAFGCKGSTPTCHTDGLCAKCKSNADCTNPAGVRLHARSECNVDTGVCEGAPAIVPLSGSSSGVLPDGSDPAAESSGCSTTGGSSSSSGIAALAAVFALAALTRRKRSRSAGDR